ncbi:MAG: 2-succinyl-5-enolpyruvyl-6-hydroxy-3-cyclohexene-1-carboxylic-acid synthase [Nitriliruptorales bacterium]|nr:2-succinyl-5-enolpyruvyl-6-hydroxy-3-cyclohexene-1-carboxylic-acid synthase [Nitriliruptorales bacterium]
MTDACLAPGSRSAPLAMALHADDRVRLHVRHDERCAGFLALGLAKASRRPVAVVCTSGSAVANLHPAVVEADTARVPLLLLTADRPPELRGTGANQTIDQIKIFGSAVRWFCEIGVPEVELVTYVRSAGSRAVGEARGVLGGSPGPVHVNLALREPLVPQVGQDLDPALGARPDGGPWTATGERVRPPAPADLAWLAERVQATERGVLAVGDTDVDTRPLIGLASAAGWPILAEPQSGARTGPNAVAAYEHMLRDAPFAAAHDPDLVITVGRLGVSKTLQAWLAPDVPQVLIDPDGAWHDPGRSVRRIITADPALTAAGIVDDLLERPAGGWMASWRRADDAVAAAFDEVLAAQEQPSEPSTARDLAAALPEGAVLTVASSMPVRDLAMFMRPRQALRVVGNRGASGIDGFVSTALGVAEAHEGPAFALAGDLSVLHDQNGFLPTPSGRPDLVIVVVNNDGGGIFSFLPQARFPRGYETLFGTPHGIDMAAFANLYGLRHRLVAAAADLPDAVLRASAAGGIHLVEVRTDRAANVALHRRLEDAAARALAEL